MTYMKAETIQDKLNTFHKAFGHPTNAEYLLSPLNDTKSLRIKLLQEEFAEVMAAIYYKKDKAAILKELCDLVYVCVGFADTFGWNFDVAFNRVHASNMSKLGENGKPLYRNDGKILKSKYYKEPDLKDLI
jgi:predicted HAD superfamily Cof-like phosphohydrolase|tara:strand:- start:1080 stop:1472 length:393 start_codon:yes stop_codon:yes gene_type:complete